MHGGGRRYGTRLRSVCSWNGQRFFAPAAIVHQSQSPDDPPLRWRGFRAAASGRACARAGGKRPPHRAGELSLAARPPGFGNQALSARDRKSTRLNSSHANISYAVFCLKKKKKIKSTHFFLKKKTNN